MNRAIVVAAGSGSRMGTDIPKQYLELGGRPVLFYSLKTLEESPLIDEVILVTAEDRISYCRRNIVEKFGFTKIKNVVAGGDCRAASSAAGLAACGSDTDIVLIHDGARPFLTHKLIEDGCRLAKAKGSAVAAVPCKDTIKVTDVKEENSEAGSSVYHVSGTPDRASLMAVQTPQVFRYDIISAAYSGLSHEEMLRLTDDASAVENMAGGETWLYEGDQENIKITCPADLEYAGWKLR